MDEGGKIREENHIPEEERVAGTDRPAEEAHLAKTLRVVQDNIRSLGHEVAVMQKQIDDMLEHYHDGVFEIWLQLNNTITLHNHMKRALERNEKALGKPYFGRIVYRDETLGRMESLYIGRGGISKDSTHQVVIDWRAPVANAYYENGLGKCSYTAPEGVEIPIDLKLKRTFEIEDGRLRDFFDTEVVTNDELLTKYLARNKEAVLGEIIATIQKEQNEVIRRSPYHNLIVQGVAGSGKTTVAMHRISFILYNYADRFKPEDFYIVGSNRILLEYITGVLPDLDVYGIRQMTMEQLFCRLLYEDWDDKKYSVSPCRGDVALRGTREWYERLKEFCRRLEWERIPRESIFLNPKRFQEGFQDGVFGVYDRSTGEEEPVELMSGEAIERYIRENPTVSVQNKIRMLNERLKVKVQDEFAGKHFKYTEAERKAIRQAYRGLFGKNTFSPSIYTLYRAFLEEQKGAGVPVEQPGKTFDVYDLAALAYLYKRVRETEVISEAHHIVVDEAQDYGMMAYAVLCDCVKDCTYTVMGDISQNIRFGYGLNDWEELKSLLLSTQDAHFGILKKSYRNTVEISHFAADILHHGSFPDYDAEPIIRHGKPVEVKKAAGSLAQTAADVCLGWQQEGLETIAVVCRTVREAQEAKNALGAYLPVKESSPEKAVFGSGVLVLPVEYVKGLEFDAVLIWNPDRKAYPSDDGHAKLLYVAATRALHELCVVYESELTGLIADPVPERKGSASRREEAEGDRIGEAGGQPKAAGARTGASVRSTADSGAEVSGRPTVAASPARRPGISLRTVKKNPPADRHSDTVTRLYSADASGQPKHGNVFAGTSGKKNAGAEPGRAGTTGEKTGAGTGSGKVSPTGEKTGAVGFGDMPPTDRLRIPGHSRIDLSVKWFTRQPDGVYFQSRYGVMRVCPLSGRTLRISFAGDEAHLPDAHPLVRMCRPDRLWNYREGSGTLEILLDELRLVVRKSTGALEFYNRQGKELLREPEKEPRQLEGTGALRTARQFFACKREEKRTAVLPGQGVAEELRGTAKYLFGENPKGLPLVLSERGYGLVFAAQTPCFSCDLPSYGTYFGVERGECLDYYFLAGESHADVTEAYCGLFGL